MNRTARTGILVFGLATALVHLVLLSLLLGELSVIFVLNGLGFLGLLGLFFLNPGFVAGRRRLLHYAFIAYTAVTILAWIPAGSRDIVGYGTKLAEVLLIVALIANLQSETRS